MGIFGQEIPRTAVTDYIGMWHGKMNTHCKEIVGAKQIVGSLGLEASKCNRAKIQGTLRTHFERALNTLDL